MTENWKSVVGYEGYYEVSDQGRVRSVDRTVTDGSRRRGRIRKPAPNGDCGHPYVTLSRGNHVECMAVHKAVLVAFVGPRPDGQEARHLDGDAANNRQTNLKWGTPAENTEDKRRHGTVQKGGRHWNAQLTEQDVEVIKLSAIAGMTQKRIGELFGIKQQAVSKIVRGQRWAT